MTTQLYFMLALYSVSLFLPSMDQVDLFANALMENEDEHSFADDLAEDSGSIESETELSLSKKTDSPNSDNESLFEDIDSENVVFRSPLVENSSSKEKNASADELDFTESSSLIGEENSSLHFDDEPLQNEFKEMLSLKESSSDEEIKKLVAQSDSENISTISQKNEIESKEIKGNQVEAESSPVVQPNCISEYDFFLKNMGTEMREKDPDDYDFLEEMQPGQTFEPFQEMKPSQWTRRLKQQRSPLLPTPQGPNQVNLTGPPGQFVPSPFQGAHGPNTDQLIAQQEWAKYWQMAFNDFWSTYLVGRTTMGGGSAFQKPPQVQQFLHQQIGPVGPSYNHGNANSGVPMSHDQTAFEYYNSTAYSTEGANFPRNQYELQYQQQQQPQFSNNHSNRGSIRNNQMKAGNTAGGRSNNDTGSYKGRVFFNQHQLQKPGNGGRNEGGNAGRQWSQHSEKPGGKANGKGQFFEQEALLAQKSSSAKGGGDDMAATASSTNDWYEFDSSEDLRPSRGHFASDARGGQQRAGGGHEGGGFANKGGAPHRGGGRGGYRPPGAANHFNKNSKNFY